MYNVIQVYVYCMMQAPFKAKHRTVLKMYVDKSCVSEVDHRQNLKILVTPTCIRLLNYFLRLFLNWPWQTIARLLAVLLNNCESLSINRQKQSLTCKLPILNFTQICNRDSKHFDTVRLFRDTQHFLKVTTNFLSKVAVNIFLFTESLMWKCRQAVMASISIFFFY